MGKLSNAREPIKALIAAESGTGKTGMLWSLAAAGFKLKIFDCDKGTPILASVLNDDPAALDRIEVNSFTDALTLGTSGYMKPKGTPKAWSDLLKACNKWPDNPEEGMNTWGPDTVAVFDSLTLASKAAMRYAMHMEGFGKGTEWKPQQSHYGTAQAQIEGLIATNSGDNCQCHVLYLTHVKNEYRGEGKEKEWIGAFPSTIGQALNHVLPSYLNNLLTIRVNGQGPTAKRYLSTKPTTNKIVTKTGVLSTKDEYLLVDGRTPKPGLAEYFADCGWEGPQ